MELLADTALRQAYHDSILACPVDILQLGLPRLKRKRFESHACDDPACRICAPLSHDTLLKLRDYATRMYKLMTGHPACHADWSENEHTPHFCSNEWLFDRESALAVSNTPMGNRSVNAREQKQRLQILAQLCDADHRPEYLAMATRYRADVEAVAPDPPRTAAVETRDDAVADLQRIRTLLTSRWNELRPTLDPAGMDELLYCATVFGVGIDDQLKPLRTDWWRACYDADKTVPGLDKPANHIHITPDTVTLIVPHCSKEPTHSATINVTADSPLLAEMLRLYEPVAREKNQGFLFRPCSLSARKKRRPRAMLKLLGKHYTAIDSRHKHVAAALGSVQERQEMARRMGTSGAMLNRYGDGAGTAGQ